MDYDLDISKEVISPLILIVALSFILIQLNTLSLDPHVDPNYVSFYIVYPGAAWIILALMYFRIHKELRIGEIFNLDWKAKAMLFGGFIFVIMLLTVGSGQLIPVPKASAASLQIGANEEIYLASIVPAFTEDAMYLIAIPLIILTLISLIYKPSGPYGLFALMVIACLIGATGYNIWLIPGFTSAHVSAYGEAQEAYLGAWIFGFGQSMVYMVTGWYVPVAHALHNAWIAAGTLYGINIGGFQVTSPS